MSRAKSGLYAPKAVEVTMAGAAPATIGGKAVESIREQWLVEDRWWSSEPLRRHYFEAVLATGRCVVLYCDLVTKRWYEQR